MAYLIATDELIFIYHSILIKSGVCCIFIKKILWRSTLTSNNITYREGHVKVHIFNLPISDKLTKSLGIKIETHCVIDQYI